MDWTHITSFVFVAGLLVMSPGPNGVLIAKTVPTSGRGAGFANVAGIVSAFYLHGALSIFGISLILVQSAQAFMVVKVLGAAYLIWLGLKALRDAYRGGTVAAAVNPARRARTLSKAYGEGFLTNALNPKVSMFYLAAFPQFIPATGNSLQAAFTLVMLHSLIAALWFTGIVLLFSHMKAVAQGGRFQRWLKAVTGAVFIGFGVKLATLRA